MISKSLQMNNKWLNYLGLIMLAGLLFGFGFYFGFKSSSANNNGKISGLSKELNSSSGTKITENVKVKEVEGLFWIKPNESPVCPSDYPIKGVFKTDSNYYYTKESKMYDRVKPDICFANEEIAKNNAGFLKKF